LSGNSVRPAYDGFIVTNTPQPSFKGMSFLLLKSNLG
jgi:hypothetical protein